MQVALKRSERSTAERVFDWIESHPATILATLSCLYWLDIIGRISTRAIWYDEIFTYYVVKLGGLPQMWSALLSGIDNHPPLFYLMTRAMSSVFTEPTWIIRMPQAITMFLAYGALLALLRPRFGLIHSINTVIFLSMLGAQYYAVEGRPYATLLAGAALAWLCYSGLEYPDDPRHRWWLGGLVLSLALSNASHYYGGLVLMPLGCAELMRSSRYGWRWRVWFAMIASLFPYLALASLYKTLFAYKTGFVSKPTMNIFYSWATDNSSFTLRVFPLFLAAKLGASFFASSKPVTEADEPFELHEMVGIVALCALPLLAFAVGKLISGAFVWRYSIPALVGWAIFFGIILWRDTNWSKGMSLASLAFLLVTAFGAVPVTLVAATPKPLDLVITAIADSEGDIVIEHGISYLEIYQAAPPELQKRLVFLSKGYETQDVAGMNTIELGLNRLHQFYPVRIVDLDKYLSHQPSFYLLRTVDGGGSKYDRVSDELADKDRRIILKNRLPNYELWSVAGASYN